MVSFHSRETIAVTMDGWIDGWVAGSMAGKKEGWMEGRMDGWMDRWVGWWMDSFQFYTVDGLVLGRQRGFCTRARACLAAAIG